MQVFDPAFVHVGDTCGAKDANGNYTDANAFNTLTAAAALTSGSIPGYPAGDTPAVRYASRRHQVLHRRQLLCRQWRNTAAPWTVWTLRAPDISTWDPTNNPIVCQAEFPGVYPETTNHVSNGTVDTNELSNLLKSTRTTPERARR